MERDYGSEIAELRRQIGAIETRVNALNEVIVDLVKNLKPEIDKMNRLVGANAMSVAQLSDKIDALKGDIPRSPQ
jgi:prefoldin subunit 5